MPTMRPSSLSRSCRLSQPQSLTPIALATACARSFVMPTLANAAATRSPRPLGGGEGPDMAGGVTQVHWYGNGAYEAVC